MSNNGPQPRGTGVLFFSHYYPPEVNAPATRTAEHAGRWTRVGQTVNVVTCAPNCPDGVVFPGYRNRLRTQTENLDGVTVTRVWTYVTANKGIFRRTLNFLSYMVSAVAKGIVLPKPMIVIATSPQFFCGWAGVWVSRIKRCPFVLEIRDIWPESIHAVGAISSPRLIRVLEWLERRLYEAADHIVAVGDGYRERIVQRAPLVAGRIEVITNGVDPDLFDPNVIPQRDFRTEWGFGGRFVCSYIGTVGMAHGLEVILDVAQMLKGRGDTSVAFAVVGDGAQRGPLEAEAARRGLGDMVRFVGRLPRDLMPSVHLASDCCLVHLRGVELFGSVIPSKIFEAMSMERPIIMGVRGAALQIVLEAGGGIEMEPDSPESLAQALTSLVSDSEASSAMGRAARSYVKEHYGRDLLAERYLGLLQVWADRSTDRMPSP